MTCSICGRRTICGVTASETVNCYRLGYIIQNARADKTEEALSAARKVLERVQWRGEGGHWDEACCPECGAPALAAWLPGHHAPDCALAKAIAASAPPAGGAPDSSASVLIKEEE